MKYTEIDKETQIYCEIKFAEVSYNFNTHDEIACTCHVGNCSSTADVFPISHFKILSVSSVFLQKSLFPKVRMVFFRDLEAPFSQSMDGFCSLFLKYVALSLSNFLLDLASRAVTL